MGSQERDSSQIQPSCSQNQFVFNQDRIVEIPGVELGFLETGTGPRSQRRVPRVSAAPRITFDVFRISVLVPRVRLIMTVDYIDELGLIRREAVWKNYRASPVGPSCVFCQHSPSSCSTRLS
jgi:hypothetical protein